MSVATVAPSAFQAVPFLWWFLVPRSNFVAAVVLITSSDTWAWGGNTITRDVNRKLLKMKFSCRVSAAIQVKNVQVTELLEWMFSLPPHLCCSCSTKALEKKEETLHLLLGSLSLCFSLTACGIFKAILFLCKIVTAGVSYAPEWQRPLFLEPGVQCWIDVLSTLLPPQLAIMDN